MPNFPGDGLTDAGSGGRQPFLSGSCRLSLLCEAEKILLPGDMGLLAILAGAQPASLNSVLVLQQVVNYLTEPVVSSSCANTGPLSARPFFFRPFQMDLSSEAGTSKLLSHCSSLIFRVQSVFSSVQQGSRFPSSMKFFPFSFHNECTKEVQVQTLKSS